jgi:probable rRNA maturation factor
VIEVVNESGEPADELALEDVARYALDRMGIHPLAELSVLLVDEVAMTELHEKWMDEPGPTDVLSFPMDELRPPGLSGATASSSRTSGEDRDSVPDLLGDIVLCPPVARQQAKQAGHSAQAEMELLCVHGILHLLGYDHAEPEEEAEMFGLQAELLRAWRTDTADQNVDTDVDQSVDADVDQNVDTGADTGSEVDALNEAAASDEEGQEGPG